MSSGKHVYAELNAHRQRAMFPVSYSIITHFYHWGLTFAALTVACKRL